MAFVPGTTVGAYQILAHLGEGGMGEVYRAHDPRLGRDVALKVLPPAMAGDPSRLERFTREARAIAALNHPHIVTIYSTEEADGIRFLTMELVDGEPLEALIPPGGLPFARFLELALPIADALTAAHLKHITHRDLKPANVMVAGDGRVKVLDFGLASAPITSEGRDVERDVERGVERSFTSATANPTNSTNPADMATSPQITTPGMIIGTMPYMSPEQVEGKTLDHRTDLFSLGVMFHEMLTGTRPFTGDSSPQLMSSILRDSPANVTDIRPDVPEALSRLLHRCLEKRPDERIQTARDIHNELRHVQKQLESGPGRRPPSDARTPNIADTLWIAVLPFTTRGGDSEGAALAEGLTEDITAGLSRFPGLSVVALQSARGFKDSSLDVRQIAERLNAGYIISGSVRRSASATRVSAHLIDARSRAQLWAETYDRGADIDAYAIQDEVNDRVVATVADKSGVLARSMVQAVRKVPLESATSRQLVLRCWGMEAHPTAAEHAELRSALESFVSTHPEDADLWAELSHIYSHEYWLGLNPLPDPLGRAERAARRAVELDTGHQQGWLRLAMAAHCLHDEHGLTEAGERAIAINPRNANTLARVGGILTYIGEYDRGCQLTERAMSLNPTHPGWYHFAFFNRRFARREFAEALKSARRVNVPDLMRMHFAIAAAAGHLGLLREGSVAAQAMIARTPELSDEATLGEFVRRWYWDEDVIESLLDGVRRARGSATAAGQTVRSTTSQARDSASGRTNDAFLITVLPFTSAGVGEGSDLADGLAQDVVVGLSRFSYLRVIQRQVSADTVAGGYLLHGSIRLASGVVRVVVQLTDASTGQSLWAETYDRKTGVGSLFDLQDELRAKIVSTIADVNGALVRTMAVVVRTKPADALTPYEAVVRALAYFSLLSPEEHAELRQGLELAVERAPNYADAWAALGFAYSEEHGQSYNLRPEASERARSATRRALELDSANQLAHFTLARLAFFAHDRSALRAATDRLIALNPFASHVISFLGMATAYAGDWEAGLALCKRAMALNPHHSGVYWMPFVIDNYRRRDYAGALEILDRINMPSFPMTLMARAAIYAQLGRLDEALATFREAETRVPGYSAHIRAELTKWFLPELVEHLEEAVEKIRRQQEARSSGVLEIRRAPEPRPLASIAVLPFADLSAEKNQDWFCDGIAEEILNALTQLPGLRVAARTSAFSLRNDTGDLRGVADKLGVATILQGSVRRTGDRIRVTVQLVDVSNGFQLWSDRYDRELKDIFDVQDEIARAVADHLKVTLTGGTDERLVARVTGNLESYELLLKGRTQLVKRGPAILDARQSFERAVALDPNLAEAHALLGDSYRLLGLYGLAPTGEMMPKARAAAERALAIDPNQVEALATLANITAVYDWDVSAGLALSERALACDPNHIRALGERGITPTMLASPPEAIADMALSSIRRARELDPLSAWAAAVECFCHQTSHRTADAVAVAHQAVALDPANFTARWVMVWTLSNAGRFDAALVAAEQALAMSGRSPRILTEMAAIHSARGNRAAAQAIDDELGERARTGFVGYAEQGAAAASAGRMPKALELVRQALAARDSYLSFWKLPAWTPFRNDPEGAAMLRSASFTRVNEIDRG